MAAVAQLAARRSHNPKVVSSILTRRIFPDSAEVLAYIVLSSIVCVRTATYCSQPVAAKLILSMCLNALGSKIK